MAKQIGGINGPYLGRVGCKVGYNWRDIWCVRSIPAVFHDPETVLQLHQRNRFGSSVKLAARLRDILLMGFYHSSRKAQMTEYNYFQKINNGCLAWEPSSQPSSEKGAGTFVVDYENLKLSEGPVAPVAFFGVMQGGVEVRGGALAITIPFEKNPEHRQCNGNDKVYVAVVNARRREAVLSLPVYRRMHSIAVEMPAAWAGDEVHLYGFVQDSGERMSSSIYIGELHRLAVEAGGGHDVVLVDELQGEEGGGFVQQKPEEDFITFPEGNRGVADTREHGKVGFLNPG